MKVRYINEGLFKTPEQMRREAEQRDAMSDEELISGEYNKVVKEEIERFLTGLFYSNENTGFRVSYNEGAIKDHMRALIFGVFDVENNGNDVTDYDRVMFEHATVQVKIRIEDGNRIYANIYVPNIDKERAALNDADLENDIPRIFCCPLTNETFKNLKTLFPTSVKMFIHSHETKLIEENNNQGQKFACETLVNSEFFLEKVHIFSDFSGDIILEETPTFKETLANMSEKVKKFASPNKKSLKKFVEIYSFENGGRCIYEYLERGINAMKEVYPFREVYDDDLYQILSKLARRNLRALMKQRTDEDGRRKYDYDFFAKIIREYLPDKEKFGKVFENYFAIVLTGRSLIDRYIFSDSGIEKYPYNPHQEVEQLGFYTTYPNEKYERGRILTITTPHSKKKRKAEYCSTCMTFLDFLDALLKYDTRKSKGITWQQERMIRQLDYNYADDNIIDIIKKEKDPELYDLIEKYFTGIETGEKLNSNNSNSTQFTYEN